MSNITQIIETRSKFGIKLGLDNISVVLDQLDNPQNKVKVVHIAGTNGKGSVSSFIASSMKAANLKVAKYCSPYLVSLTEMFLINDNQISELELEKYYNQIVMAETQVDIELTLYEVTTSIMFLYAANKKVDYLVLEVGLGGRYDATNVVLPEVSIITNISLDHTQILGDTIEAIAYEKAGIIKPGVPLFTTEQSSEALDVFIKITDNITNVRIDNNFKLDPINFETIVYTDDREYNISLYGKHQITNFLLSKAVLDYLQVDDESIRIGCANAVHPARLEKLADNIIFDGAHNPASATALVESLADYPQPINIVFSVLKDKDVKAVVTILSKLSTNLKFVPLPNLERGLSSDEFTQLQLSDVTIVNNLEQAIEDDKLNLVCGTFSLYQLIKAYLKLL